MTERRHERAHMSVGGDLIDEAEPGPYVREVYRRGEVPNGVEVFGERLDGLGRDAETGEVHLAQAELKLLRVENDASATRRRKEVDGPGPMVGEVGVPEDRVVDAPLLPGEI